MKQLSTYMQQSPWETDSYPATQEIPVFYGTWRIITMFIRTQAWTLSSAR